ncbi:hypothetical protein [Pseudonocardia sp. GCM10023141]|uniref:hypothetical protein n=1 Tax=Pseudonocardia sp. GCM10023141 TaxID=3252653 RepID=UPI00362212F3
MARPKVTDPDGVEWRVWRRWYAWRRWVTLRDVWKALPGTGGGDNNGSSSSDLDFILAIPFLLIAAVGLAVTVVDLAVQLVVLPFVLLLRLVRLMAWPVQLDRNDKHFRTLRVKGFGAAATLRDEQVAQVRDGTLAGRPLSEPAT